MSPQSAVRTAAVALTLATLGCRALSQDLPPPEGAVEIGFVNTTHLRISRIQYHVSGNGIVERSGAILLVDDGATPSALIGGLPPGPGYLLQLDATSDDGAGSCYGAAVFDVLAGRSTPIGITLICSTDQTVRTKIVNGMTDYCPSLASYAASPPQAELGGTIALTATAFSFYSDPLMFGWEATAGTLSSASAAVSTYTCTVPGTHVLTVTVTDGNCPDFATLEVTCVEALDAGEEDAASL